MRIFFLLLLGLAACQQPAQRDGGEQGGGEHAGHEHEGEEAGHGEHEGHEGEGEEGAVRLSASALRRAGVSLGEARRGSLAGVLEVPAEVQLNPARVAHVTPLVEGQLLSVEVELGARVEAGQQLARLRSVELGQARAEVSRASSLRDIARQHLERQRKLRAEGINSQRSLLEAELAFQQAQAEHEAAQSRLRVFGGRRSGGPDMALESPISGQVIERHATRGENVSPRDTLFVVADLSRVWIMGRVYEQQIAQVSVGMPVLLTLNAYPGRSWSGQVDFVGAALDEATRTLPVRVELENRDQVLRPGLFGALRLTPAQAQGDAVLVPSAAVQSWEGRRVVFVPGEHEGEYEARPVTVSRESGGQAEVVQGLAPGQALVVSGAFVLKSELVRGQLGHGHAH